MTASNKASTEQDKQTEFEYRLTQGYHILIVIWSGRSHEENRNAYITRPKTAICNKIRPNQKREEVCA